MYKLRSIAGLVIAAVLITGCASGTVQRPADLTELSVTDAAQLIRAGKVSSVELTEAYLAKADRNKHLNAFITLDHDKARAAAEQADAARAAGRGKGALNGVPLVVKDNIHVAGMPNTAGTPALRNFVPATNAPVVQKLVDAGAIVLGKTNMHELAFGISGYNEGFSQAEPIGVRNPYDRNRFAGGSSSGTGAAVGGRLAPGGLGTDTAGSVRVPAAVNGIAGLRPTIGRYSNEGLTPISYTRDTAGPLAQTVADVALLDAVITGEKLVGAAKLEGVRVGVNRAYYFAGLDADTATVMDDVIVKLQRAGVEIVEVEMPELSDLNNRTSFPVALYEAYDDLAKYLRKYNVGVTVEDVVAQIASKDVKATYVGLVVPRKLPGPDGLMDAKPVYEAAIVQARPALQKHYADTFAKNRIEALLFPATSSVAIAQGPEASSFENLLRFIRNADPGSNAGIPGLVVPAGLGPSTKMPVGIELDGPAGSDRRLLELGLAIEKVLGRTPAPR